MTLCFCREVIMYTTKGMEYLLASLGIWSFVLCLHNSINYKFDSICFIITIIRLKLYSTIYTTKRQKIQSVRQPGGLNGSHDGHVVIRRSAHVCECLHSGSSLLPTGLFVIRPCGNKHMVVTEHPDFYGNMLANNNQCIHIAETENHGYPFDCSCYCQV